MNVAVEKPRHASIGFDVPTRVKFLKSDELVRDVVGRLIECGVTFLCEPAGAQDVHALTVGEPDYSVLCQLIGEEI